MANSNARRWKALLAAGIFAGGIAGAQILGAAVPANATAHQTQVVTGYDCSAYGPGVYNSNNYCVTQLVLDFQDGQYLGENNVGPLLPVYATVTTYTASFDSPAPGSSVASTKPTLTGTAKPGDTVTIKNGSGAVLGTTVADGNGNWSFTPSSALPYGSNTLTATQSSDGNTATTTFTVLAADLSTSKTLLSSATPQLYTAVQYSLAVTNNGPSTATNVKVSDPLPAGLTYVSSSGPGSYNPSNGVWSVGTLANGQTATLALTTRIDTVNPVRNVITASSSDLPDPTPCPGACGTAPPAVTAVAPRQVVAITSPVSGSPYANSGETQPFVGTGQPGATVEVKDASGNVVCTATVDASGGWSCQPAKGALPHGDGQTVTAEQNDNGTISTDTVVLDIADSLGGPIVEPAGALLAGGLLVPGAAAALLLKRRRRADI